MSLIVTIEVLGATQEELKALEDKLPSVGTLSIRPQKDSLLFWKRKGFTIAGMHEGLAEDASAKSEHWALTPETRISLKELLAGFLKICPRRFFLYAAQSGDLPRRDTEITADELLELIPEGHLGNRVRYLVRPTTQRNLGNEALPK